MKYFHFVAFREALTLHYDNHSSIAIRYIRRPQYDELSTNFGCTEASSQALYRQMLSNLDFASCLMELRFVDYFIKAVLFLLLNGDMSILFTLLGFTINLVYLSSSYLSFQIQSIY